MNASSDDRLLHKAVRKHAQSLKDYAVSENSGSARKMSKVEVDMKRNELIRHDHTHTITGLDEIKKSHSFGDRLGSASTSISTSTPTNNEDIRTKKQRSEFILGHIKRQKKCIEMQ